MSLFTKKCDLCLKEKHVKKNKNKINICNDCRNLILKEMTKENYETANLQQLYNILDRVMNEELYQKVKEFIIIKGVASASLLQRKFRLSYDYAQRIIERLEKEQIIGPYNGTNPRKVLVSKN